MNRTSPFPPRQIATIAAAITAGMVLFFVREYRDHGRLTAADGVGGIAALALAVGAAALTLTVLRRRRR